MDSKYISCVLTPLSPFQQKLILLKLSIKSFITPYEKKREYLDCITLECRKNAIQKDLKFAFFTMISNGRGSSNAVIGRIDWKNSYIHRAIDIVIFNHLILSSKYEIKITVFHEYCHFLLKVAPFPILSQIDLYYHKNRFPHVYHDIEEDFCELFGHFIVDTDVGDQELNSFLEEFLQITEKKIDSQNWMFRAKEMPDYYLGKNQFVDFK